MSRRKRPRKPRHDFLEGLSIKGIGQYIFNPKRLTTPEIIDSNVKEFCAQISPTQEPLFLRPNPQPWSRRQYCNRNVEKMIEIHGGEMELGYRIWYVPKLYIEAERHAVWINHNGNRVDISFYPDGETSILFLPDPNLSTVLIADHLKPRAAFHPAARKLIQYQQAGERKNPVPRDDSWILWEMQQSFDQWKRTKPE